MTIRPRKLPSGKTSWQLDCGMVNGRRVQINFKTKSAAETERIARADEMKRHGAAAFELTHEDRLRMTIAREKLKDAGAGIEEAVEFFLKHAKPEGEKITFEELARRCRAAKLEEGRSPEYRRQLKSVAKSFALAGHALTPCHEITSDQVHAWLKANAWKWRTWNNYLTDLRTIFAWGMEPGQKHLAINPCIGVPRRNDRETAHEEIRFLSVEQCERLLTRAAARKAPLPRYDAHGRWVALDPDQECFQDFLPLIVVGLFCGPRPDKELGGMPCSDIKLSQKLIVITAGRAKSRRRRTVDLPPNAVAWLRFAHKHCGWTMEGRLQPKNFKRRWKRLRQQCELFDDWPHDAMRHTFATFEYALTQNEASLQVKMGHRSAQMLHAHYRGLTTAAEAKKFRALRPPRA